MLDTRKWLPTLALGLLCGCATAPRPQPDLLVFLDGAHVTEAQVTERLGEPSAAFPNDRVLTYRLSHQPGGYTVIPRCKCNSADWEGVDGDLVLAFGADGDLIDHKWVTVHATTQSH